MEYYSDDFKNILKQKPSIFRRKEEDQMNDIEFFISCKLFTEIVSAVQYLHDQNPPIIHRDIKPANILYDEKGENGIFLKLCDFGLAKLHDNKTHTRGIGNKIYGT